VGIPFFEVFNDFLGFLFLKKLGEITTHPPQNIEMNDILSQLNQMDEDKKKLLLQLISSMKGG